MSVSHCRLLVSLPPDPDLRERLDNGLAGVSYEFVGPSSRGPWEHAEALFTGYLGRELPQWRPSQAPGLRFVQSLFAGVDDFPFNRFPPPIEIASNSGAYAPFVAEHAVALVLALAKNLVPNLDLVRAGRMRPISPNRNLIGRTALILGYGGIGREVALRLRGFGMRIEGLSRIGANRPEVDRMYVPASLFDALKTADVIIDCRPLTRSTRGTINTGAFAQMKETAIFVNVGRAATVDERSLYKHLLLHPGFRAGTDVWWEENQATGTLGSRYPLATLPNFVASPHNAGFDRGMDASARARVFGLAIENLSRFFVEGHPRYVANRYDYATNLHRTARRANATRPSFSAEFNARRARVS